ncbi:MAG: HD domain-containing protein [Prevotella sp.]|nr:HD domain-containing protein [Prevotella sp.]
MNVNYNEIIDEFYPVDDELRRLLLRHSRQVANRCLLIARRHPELNADIAFLEAAAMLHDIGIRWCHAPSIFCTGSEPYIRHGLIGGHLLRQRGMEALARVCERHTGTGLTREQIERQSLPLPSDDYTPQTTEEQMVCYADKFYSKSRPDRQFTVEQAAQSLEKFGEEGVRKFLTWAGMFE